MSICYLYDSATLSYISGRETRKIAFRDVRMMGKLGLERSFGKMVVSKQEVVMIDFQDRIKDHRYVGTGEGTVSRERAVSSIFKMVYGLMFLGLALSGGVAYMFFKTEAYNSVNFTLLIILELALVLILSFFFQKLSFWVALVMFLLYSALNGATLSVIFLVYKIGTIQNAFFLTAGIFAIMAIYGTVTKADCSKVGSICAFGLIGIVIASIVNIFLKSSGLDWAISLIAIAVFTGLTMWDAQKIKALASVERELGEETVRKLSVMGALMLYLDFVNLFLNLLRLMGRKR